MSTVAFNSLAAGLLRQCADLREQQNANPFRVNAYRRAAQTLDSLPEDGRLGKLDGTSARRVAAMRAGVASLLGRAAARRTVESDAPPVATLLEVDAECRRAAAGRRVAAPRAAALQCRAQAVAAGCCMPITAAGTSRRSTRTRRERTNSVARTTGSSSTSTTEEANDV
jgi:hypothetical protein